MLKTRDSWLVHGVISCTDLIFIRNAAINNARKIDGNKLFDNKELLTTNQLLVITSYSINGPNNILCSRSDVHWQEEVINMSSFMKMNLTVCVRYIWILLSLNSFTFDSCSLLNWFISSLKVFSVSRAVRSHHKHMTCYDFIEHNETVDRLICTLPTVYIYTYTIYVFLNKSYQWRHEEGHLECVDTTKSNEVTQKCLNKAIKLFL